MKRRYFVKFLNIFLKVACCLLYVQTVNAALIDQPMTGSSAPGWVLGGSPSALLTGNGAIDPVGSGWLRLTNNTTDQEGFAYYNTPFSLSQGALIQYDYVSWGGTGADGYTVFLFDASVPSFNIGAYGGSLGYAQETGVNGLSGGYVGIGVDEYGNFANPTEGRYLGPGLSPNTVTVRGAVSSAASPTGGMQGTQSYPWIASSANNGSLWSTSTTRPSPTSADYRQVQIQITPPPNPLVNVWIQFGYNQPLTQMVSNVAIGPTPPANVMIGYAASTGGSTNYHEIRNLVVQASGVTSSIDLGVTETASVTSIATGSPVTYTVVARNYGPNKITANAVGIVDTIPSQLTGVTWSCVGSGGATCGAASGTGNNLNTTANLPFNGAATYTITGTLTSYPGSSLVNTASITIPSGIIDYLPDDNTATLTIPVTTASLDLAITKTESESTYLLYDTIGYTVVAKNNGPASAYGVGISDIIPSVLTGVNWTCTGAGGGTCGSATGSGSTLTDTVNLPVNGSVTYVITGVLSTMPSGGTISNTASLVVPTGYTDTNTSNNSATVTMSAAGTVAGSGNKPLYLYDSSTYKLSRTPMAVSAGDYVTISKASAKASWTLSPVLQLSDTINSGNIPVQLWLATNSANTYTIPLTLRCGATTVASLTTGTAALTTTPTLYSFNLPLAAAYTCPSGSAWAIDVTNAITGAGTLNVFVYPAYASNNYSNVSLSSQNVINISNSSILFYSSTYPGATTMASVNSGQTVFIRGSVTDPFGTYDINGVTLTLKDSTGTVRVGPVAMNLVYDSGAATRIYEYPYTVPLGVTSGNWLVELTAKEGTENTVSYTGQTTMPVVLLPANLLVLKTASETAANSGDIITYTITVTNTGTGVATGVSLNDSLSPYIQFGINSFGAGIPFKFTDGTPSSGLTLGTPAFSNNNGSTFVYSPTSGGGSAPSGYDGNITNYQLPMIGNMNANNANFTINYKLRVK